MHPAVSSPGSVPKFPSMHGKCAAIAMTSATSPATKPSKITGHIENDAIGNSVQWEPTIFQDSLKDNELMQRFLLYRSILESAINSYIDANGKHKIFKQEIDIIYPDTCKLFYTYHMQLIKDSLEYLRKLKNTMNSKIIYFHGLPANLIKNAGETDFKTKNKGR